MPVVWSPESPIVKEHEKWNRPKREGGMNANGYEPFPKMLYRAVPNAKGKIVCGDNPLAYRTDAEALEAERLTRQCQLTVNSADEEADAKHRGWRNHPADAIAFAEAEARAQANVAAERHFTDRRMTPQAQAEAKAADDATHEHVADVPAPKKKPRGKRVH